MVTICIPTYNRSDLLKRAVLSSINQTYKDIEIIISDNCSTTEHWDKICPMQSLDKRITIRRNETNIGFAGNLNACITASHGDYILFLCDDDELFPDIIEKQISFFHNFPKVGLVHTDGYDCSNQDRIRRVDFPEILESGNTGVRKFFLEMTVFFSSVMVRKSIYEKLGNFTLTSSADWEMWARIAKNYPIGFINQPLVKMYAHEVSKRDPAEYDKEALYLKKIIISYFSEGEYSQNVDKIYNENVGKMYINQTRLALREGSFLLGFKYFKIAKKYMKLSKYIENILIIAIKLIPSYIKHKLFTKAKYSTHV
jgi:glycosyltransferase involved in cell wall biosynthesis